MCGDRLVEEVTATVAAHPGLERISFMGHSMGGLICRYAIGGEGKCMDKYVVQGCAMQFVSVLLLLDMGAH